MFEHRWSRIALPIVSYAFSYERFALISYFLKWTQNNYWIRPKPKVFRCNFRFISLQSPKKLKKFSSNNQSERRATTIVGCRKFTCKCTSYLVSTYCSTTTSLQPLVLIIPSSSTSCCSSSIFIWNFSIKWVFSFYTQWEL